METRKCKECGQELPMEMFMRTPVGLSCVCRECVRKKKAQTRVDKKAMRAKAESVDEVKSQRLSEFTPRELLAELKRRGYRWKSMEVTITKEIDYNKI